MYLLQRPEDIPPRLTNRLNVRIAVLGALVVAAVATVLLRLWSLQVLDGEHYRALAQDHGVLDVRVHPPRGEILDRNGQGAGRQPHGDEPASCARPTCRAIAGERQRELAGWASLLGLSQGDIRQRVRETPAVRRLPGRAPAGTRPAAALLPAREQGVASPASASSAPTSASTRTASLAAHILGLVGQISPHQLTRPAYRSLKPGDIIGQAGVEYTYDKFLRGTAGSQRIQVDALGRPAAALGSRPAQAGDNLRLTLDSGLQEVGEAALRAKGLPGAFVAMNVHTGAILGMGSYPTYDPSFYTQPHTKAQYDAFGNQPGDPLVDRADQGGYPTGLGVQADHRDRRARGPPDLAEHDLRRHGLARHRRDHAPQRGRRRQRPGRHEHRAQGLLGRLLLQPRSARAGERQRRPDPGLGVQVRPGPEARQSTSRTPPPA